MRREGAGYSFDQHITGIYGESSTTESHRIEYLLTTMPINQAVSKLSSALDVLDFNKIEFSQLVQRDIDIGRVRNGIINGYLKKGADSRNKNTYGPIHRGSCFITQGFRRIFLLPFAVT